MKRLLPVLLAALTAGELAAADFTVTNANNSGPGSLFQAITDANSTPGADRVLFNIPGPGVHKIDVSQNLLPTVSESLVIDGYSQPGAIPNSLTVGDNAVILIQIDGGAGTATARGLVLMGTGSDYLVRGLCLTGFGLPTWFSNVAITADNVHSALVVGNFVGVLPDGETPRGNSVGIGHVTQLGGSDPALRNIISGNSIGFAGEASPALGAAIYGAIVQGNYIGTNAAGTKAVPNGTGIRLRGLSNGSVCNGTASGNIDLSNTIIGGTARNAGNVISGNGAGILLGGFVTCGRNWLLPVRIHGVQIKGNLIGVQPNGATALPNRWGIELESAAETQIGGLEPGAGNIIAFNEYGVLVGTYRTSGELVVVQDESSQRNQILSNAIYGNRIGSDLGDNGPTANDPGDSEAGPNNYQNYPVIQSADIANGSVTIKGTLNSSPNAQFTLQYFAESRDLVHPVQTYLGTSTITTDANGNAPFAATFALSDTNVAFNMTATSQDGNTSEFAQHPARLKNISTRANVEGGDHAPIAGMIVRNAPQVALVRQILIRALGPSLPGVLVPLPDPIVQVFDSKGNPAAANDNWREDGDAPWVTQAGLAPPSDLEAAVWNYLWDNRYTAMLQDAHGSPGIGLVELYDSNFRYDGVYPTHDDELLNLSTRGFVGAGDNVMIAGMILEQGAGSTRIVVRAIGPSLGAFGVADPLADPAIELRDSQGAMLAFNDDWRTGGQSEALAEVGMAPSSDRESAVFMRLSSGAYTAIVRGKGSATGVALVEIYNLH